MKLYSTIILICIITISAYSQYNPGAKQISLSNSDVALSNDVFCLFNNPAGLAQIKWREAGIYYSPAPFGMPELANGFAAYHEPTDYGSFALGGMSYGFDLYREAKFILGYSYNIQNKFFIGTAINYQTVSIKNYGSDGALFFNLGGMAYLSAQMRIAFVLHNLNRASIGSTEDQIPVLLNTGISYDIRDDISINIAIEKELRYKASVLFGINYDIVEYLSLRSGFSNEPSRYSAGIGINFSFFSLDYAVFTHNDLGLTHQAGVIFRFSRDGAEMK